LNLIPSSHLLGGLPFNRKQKNLLASPQNRINKKYYKNKKIDKFNMSIGDVLLMDSKVIHRSGKNFSKMLRFTILTRMVSTLNKTFIPGRLIYQNKDDYNKNLLKKG
jgi:ectoine hydroxylase-related dioxygenase (phytanoyl-CoA dioxygenase family)